MPENRTAKGFSAFSVLKYLKFSSQARYDHFDTLPYSQRIIFYQTKRDLSNNICNIRLNMLKYFLKVRWGNANLQCLSEEVQC